MRSVSYDQGARIESIAYEKEAMLLPIRSEYILSHLASFEEQVAQWHHELRDVAVLEHIGHKPRVTLQQLP